MRIFYSIRQTFQESKKKRDIFFYTVPLFKGVVLEWKPLFRVGKYFRTYPPKFCMDLEKNFFGHFIPTQG